MLFNSYPFIAVFLPLTLLGFFCVARRFGVAGAVGFFFLASLFFYGWWNPAYLPLLLLSMVVNYAIGRSLNLPDFADTYRKRLVIAGVVFNLGLLGYYKYANFAVDSINYLFGSQFTLAPIALPLAISFFTFLQIAFLVECYRIRTHCPDPLRYGYFVAFFPHLIAGPIVRSAQVFPQLTPRILKFNAENMSVGITFFVFGLFKKVVVADNIAKFASPVFDQLPLGVVPSTVAAWLAIFAYSLQLYFDFSGYSDMAIGLARMFNIKLPANFDSPYKARNLSEFWRRWHMTLSAFLRDHVYIPLGGNKGTEYRVQTNLLITMLLGGLWHGAGLGFVVWGAVNGILLLLHRNFRLLCGAMGFKKRASSWYVTEAAITLTFLCIMLSRVTFRAPDWNSSILMWESLLGLTGGGFSLADVLSLKLEYCAAFLVYLVCRCMPNTQQMLASFDPVLGEVKGASRKLRWAPNAIWGAVVAAAALACIVSLDRPTEFLYFQF